MVVLLENKADPNVQDKEGRTALHWLCNNGYLDAIKLLLGFGAFPNHMENNEESHPRHCGSGLAHLQAAQGSPSHPRIHSRVSEGSRSCPGRLGVRPSQDNVLRQSFRLMTSSKAEGYTPLDYALLGAHHEVIQFMLERGALSIAAIQDIAAVKIQAVYKGYKVRKAFHDRKNLLMKHEQLRKDAAAK
uniref:Uncharacterized protein n=1 Tax=Sphaerodactylus townsendi TaxID=933632 RepID=A0ACB8FTC0_9SAUR